MPFEKVDINTIKLDDQSEPTVQASVGFEPVDINALQLDQPDMDFAPQPMPSVGRTALEQGMAGATFGLGNRVMDAIGAGIASAATGEPLMDLYGQAREMSRQSMQNQAEQRPVLSFVSQLGGGLATGLPFAGTKAGSAISGWAGRGVFSSPQGLAQRAVNLFTKSVKGAALGAATGAAYGAGTTTGDMGEAAKSGALTGAALGAAVPVAGAALGGAASALAPKIDEGLQPVAELAQKYNIPISAEQLTSSKPVKTFQKISQEIPLSGVGQFREKQMAAFNRALTNTFGQDATRITPEVMDKAFTTVGREFDNLGKGKTFVINEAFKQQADDIINEAAQYATKDAQENFSKVMETISKNIADDGTISGEKLSFLRSHINKLARKASAPDTIELLKDAENLVIDLMTEGDDIAKGALSAAKQKYKNLLAIEPLAQKAKAGEISPTLLANRVAKIYGRAYTRGQAGEIGDLARVGKELLPELGGSDTAQKLMQASAIGGGIVGMATNPAATLGAAAGAAPILAANRAAQKFVMQNQKLVGKMIEKGKKVAPEALSKPAQYVTLPDGTIIPRVTIPVKKP